MNINSIDRKCDEREEKNTDEGQQDLTIDVKNVKNDLGFVQDWSDQDVLQWLTQQLTKTKISDKMCKTFLNEFSQKCVTGVLLLELNHNKELMDQFVSTFSQQMKNAFGIWFFVKQFLKNVAKETNK